MKRDEEETSRYFQVVSRFFLEQRGGALFLSSNEVEKIREWKNMGIPLPIVLDGIKDCFGALRKKPGRRGKISSLSVCHAFVLQGYDAYKQRWVGRKRRPLPQEDKREKLKMAVGRFLDTCPENLAEIRRIYSRLQTLILEESDDQDLEELELEVEALLVRMSSGPERKKIQDEVFAEFGDKSEREMARIIHLKWIKHLREKYAIPHIPLYYY
jgi:hypothetical protein